MFGTRKERLRESVATAGALLMLAAPAGAIAATAKAPDPRRSPDEAPSVPAPPKEPKDAGPRPPAEIGPAPDFSLSDLKGLIVDSSYVSRPVTVVHFWATWCVPCMREIPDLNRLAERYEPSGAAIYAVAVSSGSAGDLRQVARSFDIRHTVLVGDDALAEAFGGVPAYPVTFLVDSRGQIVERHDGASRKVQEHIEKSIRGLLAASGRRLPPKP